MKKGQIKNIIGERHNKLIVLKLDHVEKIKRGYNYFYECLCDCGNKTIVSKKNLKTTKSCGCSKVNPPIHVKHGKYNTPLYKVWGAMKDRCNCKTHKSYKYYGGRGITVCKEWYDFNNFENWALANNYVKGLDIDRIDNNGNYEPNNCRWTIRKVNVRNTRRKIMIAINGTNMCLGDWADSYGFNYHFLYQRYSRGKRGLDLIHEKHIKI